MRFKKRTRRTRVVHFVSSVFDRVAIQKRPRRDGTRERKREDSKNSYERDKKRDRSKAHPTRRNLLPFRRGESTSEAHRTRRRPRGRRVVEEEKVLNPLGGLLLRQRVVVMMMLPFYLFRLWVLFPPKEILFFSFPLHPKNPKCFTNPK